MSSAFRDHVIACLRAKGCRFIIDEYVVIVKQGTHQASILIAEQKRQGNKTVYKYKFETCYMVGKDQTNEQYGWFDSIEDALASYVRMAEQWAEYEEVGATPSFPIEDDVFTF